MCQVNGGGPYSAPWGSETPEPIHLKFGVFDYVHRPTRHANTVAAVNGGGHRGEVVPSRAFSFFIFFGSFNTSTAYPEKRDFRSMHSKMCFGGG